MRGKTVVITGATSGNGEVAALALAKMGARIIAVGRSKARRDATLARLRSSAPGAAHALHLADLSRLSEMKRVAAQIADQEARIDVLINNAGYGIVGAVEETPDSALRALMETNFFGAVAVIRAALPTLRAQRSGAIVNISSLGGQLSFAGFGAYSASKFALEGISEALAQEVAPFGVKVLLVEPGNFRTNLLGSGTQEMPATDAYRESVGGTREFARGMHGAQVGDPLKAARAIDLALEAEKTPLRLQLGEDAVAAVRAHAQTMLEDLNHWQAVAVDTRLDGATDTAKSLTAS